ncbi:RNA polymerase sigma factor [Methylomicrobium album]|uniref:RNA polymerase sigma factor n=1 Tax=Methylomicrobium album BG8 TaxID=686340 RepID=H8GHT6_METAL|nr:RNA polymerase sigma factor [Methylomicrobium album]EIC31404.1 RNA polymerase sigma factor, sigma-70 family [Methylomicrobium album BG8]
MTEKISHNMLQAWFHRYSSDLEIFFCRKIGESDAPDLVQEVYLRAITYSSSAAIIQPRAFLFKIAANLVVDHVRKQSYRQCDNYEEIEEETITSILGPEDALCGKERLRKFRDALAQLPADHRQAFLLNRFEGLSHMEIAQFMGVSDKTVKRYITKAFDHCLSSLEL